MKPTRAQPVWPGNFLLFFSAWIAAVHLQLYINNLGEKPILWRALDNSVTNYQKSKAFIDIFEEKWSTTWCLWIQNHRSVNAHHLAEVSIALVLLITDLRCISVDLYKSIAYECISVQIKVWPVGYVCSKGQRRRPINRRHDLLFHRTSHGVNGWIFKGRSEWSWNMSSKRPSGRRDRLGWQVLRGNGRGMHPYFPDPKSDPMRRRSGSRSNPSPCGSGEPDSLVRNYHSADSWWRLTQTGFVRKPIDSKTKVSTWSNRR
jgi:hypothetical protein